LNGYKEVDQMSQIDKLIAKALSTSSDEEAMSAFNIARKRFLESGSGTYTGSVKSENNSQQDWERKARAVYAKYKEQQSTIVELQKKLYFSNKSNDLYTLKNQLSRSNNKIANLTKELTIWKNATFMLCLILMVVVVPVLISLIVMT
jgi:hypothetical protein